MVVCGAHLRLCGGRMLSRRWLCKRQTPAPQPQHISDPALSELCHRFPAILSRRTSRAEDLFHVHSAALGWRSLPRWSVAGLVVSSQESSGRASVKLKWLLVLTDSGQRPSFIDLLAEQLAEWPGGCPPMVLEANAGPGLLSRRLLERDHLPAGTRIRLFEHRSHFLAELKAQVEAWPGRLELVQANLLHMHNHEEQLLEGIPARPWTEEPAAVLVASLSRSREVGFLRYLLHQLPMGTSLFMLGRLPLLVFMSHTEASHITAGRESNFKHYRDISILYQLFFDIKMCGEVSRDLFLPPRGAKQQSPLQLMRLMPRRDLWELVDGTDRLHELVFFVRQNMVRRTAYVLPCLEKWIPGCGPQLLRAGATRVFERTGDLSPERMLYLFHLFSALPEYPQSAFTAAAVAARESPIHS
ncbi:mitochondrial transcription factor B2 isoform X3 [Amblyomma americanum]